MKKLILIVVIALSAEACVAPIKPIPPIGCSYSDAILVHVSYTQCKWVYVNCGNPFGGY